MGLPHMRQPQKYLRIRLVVLAVLAIFLVFTLLAVVCGCLILCVVLSLVVLLVCVLIVLHKFAFLSLLIGFFLCKAIILQNKEGLFSFLSVTQIASLHVLLHARYCICKIERKRDADYNINHLRHLKRPEFNRERRCEDIKEVRT